MPAPATLEEEAFGAAVARLARLDARFGRLVADWGVPPFWTHPPGFAGLVLAILAQQVSIESARAAYAKLARALGRVTAERFLSLDAEDLRAIGFSRQKAGYASGIAGQIAGGQLDLAALRRLDDEAARERLMQLRGIGKWTADTYLLFSLRRADVWPSGDLALEIAVSELNGRRRKLATATVDRMARDWRPLRAVAARLLWGQYLSRRGRLQAAQPGGAPRQKGA